MSNQTRTVPFLDLRVTDDKERQALLQAADRVLRHGRLINGPELTELEGRFASACGRKFAVGVASGTDAVYLGLRALGVGPGDEVVTTSMSWIATANAIALTGATPVFADVSDDLNIDPKSVDRLVSDLTKAILPVHYTGRICDMDALQAIADRCGAAIIEDSAQAFGARQNGTPAGSWGRTACFSMNSMKSLASLGEAGMILTDDEDIKDRLESLRYNGTINRETCLEPGTNSRLETLHAAMLLVRLDGHGKLLEKRRAIAARYEELLDGVVDIPVEGPEESHGWYTYTIQADDRDELMAHLAENGIETKIQHPILMPEQPAYKEYRRETANAKKVVKRILSLPANEKVSLDDVEYVAATIRDFYGEGA